MLRINYRLTVTRGENISILLIFNCRTNNNIRILVQKCNALEAIGRFSVNKKNTGRGSNRDRGELKAGNTRHLLGLFGPL
jgi:hypothetical protein